MLSVISKGLKTKFFSKSLFWSTSYCVSEVRFALDTFTAWKVSKYGVISGPYFPVFGLNADIYFVNLCIQSEYRKIRTRNNSVFGHFSHSISILFWKKLWCKWLQKVCMLLVKIESNSRFYILLSGFLFTEQSTITGQQGKREANCNCTSTRFTNV